MKNTEVFDIVIIFFIMIASVSFFTIMVSKLDGTTMHYMKDKTIYEFNGVDEQEAVSKFQNGISINPAQSYLMLSVQDNYCPYLGYLERKGKADGKVEITAESYLRTNRLNYYPGAWKKTNSYDGLSINSYLQYYHSGGLNTGDNHWVIK